MTVRRAASALCAWRHLQKMDAIENVAAQQGCSSCLSQRFCSLYWYSCSLARCHLAVQLWLGVLPERRRRARADRVAGRRTVAVTAERVMKP